MKPLNELNAYRRRDDERRLYGLEGDDFGGVFAVGELRIVASSGDGWDHVSVSLPNRCPTWAEMEKVKRLFFRRDEVAMQLHVPERDHVNFHPFCLHLWRPLIGEIPRPPAFMVGPTT